MQISRAETAFGINSWRNVRIAKANVSRAYNERGAMIQGVVPALAERTVEAPSVVEHSLAHIEAAVKLVRMQAQDQESAGKAGYKPLVTELGEVVNLKLFTGQTPAVFDHLTKAIPTKAEHIRSDCYGYLIDLIKRDIQPFLYRGDPSLPINMFALLHLCDPSKGKVFSHGIYSSTDDYVLFDAALRVLLKPEGSLPWDVRDVEDTWRETNHIRNNCHNMMNIHLVPMMEEDSDIKSAATDMFGSINPLPGIRHDGNLVLLKETLFGIMCYVPNKNWSISPETIMKIVPGCNIQDIEIVAKQLVSEGSITRDGAGRYHST
ncbi:MAG: hypothetical protein WC527_08885 [Candidatus Margulisiibacteriota bacterium]